MSLRNLGPLTLAAALSTCAGAAGAATPFDCVMEPSLVVKLGSPVVNLVADVDVERGDVVKKGQVVAHIEASAERAAVAYNKAKADSTAEIQAKQAVLDQKAGVLRRKIGLQKDRVGSAQDVENAQADYNVAKQEAELARLNHTVTGIELSRAETDLELRTIRSPIDGLVTQRSIGPGEFFHQESTIVTIARIDPLNVETYLPVRYFKLIKVGDVATVYPNDPVGGERKAKVTVVDRVFDAASGTYGVRLELPNADNELPAGLRCRVSFDVADPPDPLANARP
jgi:RND family efflux transporter MFP subunit